MKIAASRHMHRGRQLSSLLPAAMHIAAGSKEDSCRQLLVQIPPFCAAIGQKDRTDPTLIQQHA